MRNNNLAILIFSSALCFSGHSDADEVTVNEIIRSLAPGVQSAYKKLNGSIDLEVRFKKNSAKLTKQAEKQLGVLAEAFLSERLGQSKFIIAGHTDASGAAKYNKSLSLKRAKRVVEYLELKFRINRERFTVKGYGEERLKDNYDANSRINRRVEVTRIDNKKAGVKSKDKQFNSLPEITHPKTGNIKW